NKKVYFPQKVAHVPDFNSYLAMYKRSTEDPEEFWREVAQEIYLYKPLTGQMLQYNFDMTKDQTPWDAEYDVWWDDVMNSASEECEPEWLYAEDLLFILYSSGSTGKHKGILHTIAGYLLYTSLTFKHVFDFHLDDVYWCTADIGWITGHSYITYGPLANGATSVLVRGHVLTPLPAATALKPGSATLPFYCVQPTILNEHGEELDGEAEGYLVFWKPWPGIMRGIYQNQEQSQNTYFKKFPGFYVTWKDGHLLSTAEVEEHPAVAEAAVVSFPHTLKGECLYCYMAWARQVIIFSADVFGQQVIGYGS
ncbi:acyl-CoA synthetase short chain family member 2 like isoform X2, partial [Tachysurus ichikawai]